MDNDIVSTSRENLEKFIRELHRLATYVKIPGDMLSVIGLFTNEANENAKKFTESKMNIINLTNENMRTIQRDFVQTIYAFTKHPTSKNNDIPSFKNLSRSYNF